MTVSELIETNAMEKIIGKLCGEYVSCVPHSGALWDTGFETALEYFADELKEQGLTIVPLEPTEEMVLAVTDAWGWDVPLAFWKDMIAAYEKERENG